MHFVSFGLLAFVFLALSRFEFESLGTLSPKTFESFRPRNLKGCEAYPSPRARIAAHKLAAV